MTPCELAATVTAPSDPHWGAAARWASRSPGVVAVDSIGNARGVAVGDAWLVVSGTSGRQVVARDSVRVHVEPTSRSLKVVLPRDSVTVDDTLSATTSVDTRYGAAPSPASLRYSSSDTLIARVDSLTGKVVVHGDGDVTISATDGSRTASALLRSYLITIATGGVRLREISVGWGFACGLDAAGAAYCWGTRTLTGLSQQLTLDQRTVPVAMTFPQGTGRIVRIDVGTRGPLCAIDDAGVNYCFGDNAYNGIGGNGSVGGGGALATVSELRPVPGTPAGGLQSIGTGELHGRAATTAGALWCWGSTGSWGTTPSTNWLNAAPVGAVPAFHDVVAGFQATCALAADGTPWCGGVMNAVGDRTGFRALALRPGAAPLVRLEGGSEFTCGLAANGEASCWAHGQPLLTPVTFDARQPVPLSRRERFVDVGAGPSGVCGVTAEGAVRCLTFKLTFQ